MTRITPIDWLIISGYIVYALLVAVFMRQKKEEGNLRSFFLSNQNLPWWLLGISMVATTTSASTPVFVAGWAYKFGIARNWEWWCFLPGGMLTAFFFARLWRRTNVITDAEYTELRYGGKSAAFLRGFRALYMGFILNCFVLGGGLVAMAKMFPLILGFDPDLPTGWNIPLIRDIPSRYVFAVLAACVAVSYPRVRLPRQSAVQ